jgi:hypothetical protein
MITNFAAGRAHSLALVSAIIPLVGSRGGGLSWALSVAGWIAAVALVVIIYRATERPAGAGTKRAWIRCVRTDGHIQLLGSIRSRGPVFAAFAGSGRPGDRGGAE